MSSDFAAGLDAALNARLQALRSAADEAKRRIDRGIDAASARMPVPPGTADALDFGTPATNGAAVSFDPDEELDVPVDAEGIPAPEENT